MDAQRADWVFAYGSNMYTTEVRRAFSERDVAGENLVRSEAAVLSGARLSWNFYSRGRRSGAANVIRAPRYEQLEGVALLVTSEGLQALDRKEGFTRSNPGASAYRRQRRRISLSSGEEVMAWVYKANPRRTKRTTQRPSRGYVELMLRGAAEHHLSARWIVGLQAIETVE